MKKLPILLAICLLSACGNQAATEPPATAVAQSATLTTAAAQEPAGMLKAPMPVHAVMFDVKAPEQSPPAAKLGYSASHYDAATQTWRVAIVSTEVLNDKVIVEIPDATDCRIVEAVTVDRQGREETIRDLTGITITL